MKMKGDLLRILAACAGVGRQQAGARQPGRAIRPHPGVQRHPHLRQHRRCTVPHQAFSPPGSAPRQPPQALAMDWHVENQVVNDDMAVRRAVSSTLKGLHMRSRAGQHLGAAVRGRLPAVLRVHAPARLLCVGPRCAHLELHRRARVRAVGAPRALARAACRRWAGQGLRALVRRPLQPFERVKMPLSAQL